MLDFSPPLMLYSNQQNQQNHVKKNILGKKNKKKKVQ